MCGNQEHPNMQIYEEGDAVARENKQLHPPPCRQQPSSMLGTRPGNRMCLTQNSPAPVEAAERQQQDPKRGSKTKIWLGNRCRTMFMCKGLKYEQQWSQGSKNGSGSIGGAPDVNGIDRCEDKMSYPDVHRR